MSDTIVLVKRIIKKIYVIFPDRIFIKILWNQKMKYKLNLNEPRTFNEKLQWLKLNDRKTDYTDMVDKYAVRAFISKKIGTQYLIPLLGVWNNVDDIPFSNLPNKFVLKTNHDSGGVIICRDKNALDIKKTKKLLKNHMKTNYFYSNREWPYKNIKPKIICEKFMEDELETELNDYKFFCFNGYVDCVMVCLERSSGKPKFYFFDKDWKFLKLNQASKKLMDNFSIPKPSCIDEMFRISSELSRGFKFIRVDLYCCNNKIYFGELTFFPESGYDSNLLEETDLYFGDLIEL